MTEDIVEEEQPQKTKWGCTVCKAEVEWDLGPPLIQAVSHSAETGPYSYTQKAHDCPVRKGLLPAALKDHPNASRVE